jgi:hypothetical protein
MANIKVKDLISIAGTDLFNDSESFMRDLSDDELDLQGGGFWFAAVTVVMISAALHDAYLQYQELQAQEPSTNSYSSR